MGNRKFRHPCAPFTPPPNPPPPTPNTHALSSASPRWNIADMNPCRATVHVHHQYNYYSMVFFVVEYQTLFSWEIIELNENQIRCLFIHASLIYFFLWASFRCTAFSFVHFIYYAESQIHKAEQFEWLTKEHICVLVYLVRMSIHISQARCVYMYM